jgi:hypothetical protein
VSPNAGQFLMDAGAWFRRMPPCWLGDRIVQPVYHPDGFVIGWALMGTGFLLAGDLPDYGLRRGVTIPHVFERSQVLYAQEVVAQVTGRLSLPALGDPWYRTVQGRVFCPERAAIEIVRHGIPLSPGVQAAKRLAAAITTYDGIITARAGGNANDATMAKVSITTVAQVFFSLFRAGGLPVAGTYTNIPTGAVHTRSSTGAWSGITALATGTNRKYLLTMGFGSTSAIDWGVLVDLLVGCGNISHANTANTVSSTAETRQYGTTLGAGVMASFDVTTALGATAGTIAMNSYTDQDGNTGADTGTVTCSNSAIAQRLEPTSTGSIPPWMPLASGDFGVRAVATVTTAGNTGGGVSALNLVFPLAYVPGCIGNVYIERDSTTQIDGLTELVQDGSDIIGCLTWFVQTNTTTSGTFRAFARCCEG